MLDINNYFDNKNKFELEKFNKDMEEISAKSKKYKYNIILYNSNVYTEELIPLGIYVWIEEEPKILRFEMMSDEVFQKSIEILPYLNHKIIYNFIENFHNFFIQNNGIENINQLLLNDCNYESRIELKFVNGNIIRSKDNIDEVLKKIYNNYIGFKLKNIN